MICPKCFDPEGIREKVDYKWRFQCLFPGCDFSCPMKIYRREFKDQKDARGIE